MSILRQIDSAESGLCLPGADHCAIPGARPSGDTSKERASGESDGLPETAG